MGLADDTMAKLAERHAAEKTQVRDVTRRYERAAAVSARALAAFDDAESERAAVLAEWVSVPGWGTERVAECVGLALRDVSEALRSAAATTVPPRERVPLDVARAPAGEAAARPGPAPRVVTGPARRGAGFDSVSGRQNGAQ